MRAERRQAWTAHRLFVHSVYNVSSSSPCFSPVPRKLEGLKGKAKMGRPMRGEKFNTHSIITNFQITELLATWIGWPDMPHLTH